MQALRYATRPCPNRFYTASPGLVSSGTPPATSRETSGQSSDTSDSSPFWIGAIVSTSGKVGGTSTKDPCFCEEAMILRQWAGHCNLAERDKEVQERNEQKMPKALLGHSGGKLPGRSTEERRQRRRESRGGMQRETSQE